MKVSVVIPTIQGRGILFDKTRAAYEATKPDSVEYEVIVVRDCTTIGEAWRLGAAAATGDWVHLSADDVLPHEGWFQAALDSACRMEYPSPRLENKDGSLHSCGTMGGGMLLPECPDGTRCNGSPFPFFRADYLTELLGGFPSIHYYADDLLAQRASAIGLSATVCRDYCFTHLEGTHGRAQVAARAMADQKTFLDCVAGGSECE